MKKSLLTRFLRTFVLLPVLLIVTQLHGQTWKPKYNTIGALNNGYYEYLPVGYDGVKKFPVIVFLHGLGEQGNGSTDLPIMLNAGLPKLINQGGFPQSVVSGGKSFSFIVIAPQFWGWPSASDVDQVINDVVARYSVDVSRIYLTGLSMGGGATWDHAGMSSASASRLAAIVPNCGASYPDATRIKNIAQANLPVLAVHNDGDPTVPSSYTNDYVNGINTYNPSPLAIKLIWSGTSHNCWDKTYDPANKIIGGMNCYEWMLQNARGVPPVPAPTVPLSVSLLANVNVSCNGGSNGSSTVSASGGTAPYTYSWNTVPVQTAATVDFLKAGSYTVTVKDANNNTATYTTTIAEPSKLVLTVSAGAIAVNGGTTNVTLSATGGTAPYTFTGTTTNVKAGTYTYTVKDAKGCTDSKSITITEPALAPVALAASISGSANVSCNGGGNGSASVSATGGTAPYSYSWNTVPVQTTATASNLKAGTYTVTVKDANNTTTTASATINEPSKLVLSVSAGTIATNGGTTNVSVSATGGTATYVFSGPTTNVKAGTYNYTVTDAKGCTDSKSITITEPAAAPPPPPAPAGLSISFISHTDVTCKGAANGKASVTAAGGSAPYSYSWNTNPAQLSENATGLAPGTYTVTVKDAANSTTTSSVIIAEPAVLTISAQTPGISSFGGSTNVTLNATGGTAPYSYEGQVTNVVAGTYTYIVTDANGCKASTSLTVAEPSQMNLMARSAGIKCAGGTTSVYLNTSGGVAPYSYLGDTVNVKAGTYSFSVTDAKGAKATTTLTVSEPTALALTASPGTITTIGGTTSVSLVATGGTPQYIYTGTTTALKAGTYSYQVKDANGCGASTSLDIREPGVNLSALTVTSSDTMVNVNWTTSYEYGIDRFEVEKAKDNKTFVLISRLLSKGNSVQTLNRDYMARDANSIAGSNTYKLYAVTLYGQRILLGEKKLFFADKGTAKVRNLSNQLQISVTSSTQEKVNVLMYDLNGKPISQNTYYKNQNVLTATIPMDNLKSGLYIVKVLTQSGLEVVKQVAKQ